MYKIITSFKNGNIIIFDENSNTWLNSDEKILIDQKLYDNINSRPCPKCGHLPTKEGHDYCLSNLPGVKNACCGHGIGEGYIQFENGITIRGHFKTEYDINFYGNKETPKYIINFFEEEQPYNLIFSKNTWKKILNTIKTIPNIEESE